MSEFQVTTPFPLHAVPRIWTWAEEFRHQVMDDFGPKSLAEFVTDWEMKAELRESWAIEHNGEIGGMVCVDRVSPVLGHVQSITKRAFWGAEKMLEPMREIYGHAFALGYQKIYSLTFTDNSNVIHLARKLGATREGKLRQHTIRNGKLVDMLIMGLTQEDFTKCLPS